MKINMIGKRFGRLVVREEVEKQCGRIAYLCECDCGNKVKILSGNLRNGGTKSCGCLQIERAKEANTTHGMADSKTYMSWLNMVARCTNSNHKRFKDYGGRGIKVCEEWLKFENFLADMGEPIEGLTIERKNNELGYFKDNCCWATIYEQNQNKRLHSNNKTGIKGCSWHKQAKKYQVMISANNKHYYIGYFKTLDEARIARQKAERKYWREQI